MNTFIRLLCKLGLIASALIMVYFFTQFYPDCIDMKPYGGIVLSIGFVFLGGIALIIAILSIHGLKTTSIQYQNRFEDKEYAKSSTLSSYAGLIISLAIIAFVAAISEQMTREDAMFIINVFGPIILAGLIGAGLSIKSILSFAETPESRKKSYILISVTIVAAVVFSVTIRLLTYGL